MVKGGGRSPTHGPEDMEFDDEEHRWTEKELTALQERGLVRHHKLVSRAYLFPTAQHDVNVFIGVFRSRLGGTGR